MEDLLIVLLICHVIGDFYAQTVNMARDKDKDFKLVIKHSLIYSSLFIIPILLYNLNINIIIVCIAISLWHFIVDALKGKVINKLEENNHKHIFVIDQLLHIGVIVFVYAMVTNMVPLDYISVININIFKWILALLLVGKPANVVFKTLFGKYKPEKLKETSKQATEQALVDNKEAVSDSRNIRAGALIGFLERVLVLIFLAFSSFTAIGIVLTVKSITRYNKIANEPEFAEYYLIGTLTSLLFAIISYILFIFI